MTKSLAKSLQGVRVLDASRVLAGPFAGQVLADLGAEVIKVEEPRGGDETRAWGPPFLGDLSAYFLAANRGKRGVALDLKQAEGRELFLRLAGKCDVVLENFRADSAQSLGLLPKDLHARNQRLVICSLSGFGREGDAAARPGYDFVVQGLSGMMASTGPAAGEPYKVGVAMADIVTGLYAAVAVLAGLKGRESSGHGYAIDLALLDCAVASMANVAQSYLTSGRVPTRQGNAHLQIVPYELFETADGLLVLAVGNDGQFKKFCTVAGVPGMAAEPRFATNVERVKHRAELVPQVAALMRTRKAAAWEKALAEVGVPCGPVWKLDQLFSSDLAAARGLKLTVKRPDGTPVDLVRSPLVPPSDLAGAKAPPTLGQDTAAVLGEILGLGEADLKRLSRDGVI